MDYKELVDELRILSSHVPEQMDNDDGKNALDDAADAIETLLSERKSSGWISVKDKLPKCNVPCLICIDGKPQTECASIDCYDDEIIWFWTNNDFESEGEVTHWMPLPEPPEVHE